ncbi:hypothetical protein ABZY09_05960 [Streptomyces sp. NPDC002928]|uniref:hypothetical protein n=1 Tax=Streptomyces sp. NPDC002928 TaxID=3154440 RepID=UPI0033BF4B32
MPTRHTLRPHSRLLLTATALVAAAALLRIVSPDGQADAGPGPNHGPSHSTTPTKSPHPSRHTAREQPRSTTPTGSENTRTPTDSENTRTPTDSENAPTPGTSPPIPQHTQDDKPPGHPTASTT